MSNKGKIRSVIAKLKEAKERLGEEKIKNVSRPHKLKPDKKKDDSVDKEGKKRKKTPTAVGVGPRGGSYRVAASGRKIYESSRNSKVKKSMEDYLKHIEEIDRFIDQFKIFKGLM